MNPECQRWAELADLQAVGEPLTTEGLAFQRAHEATCAHCVREAALWRAVKVQHPAPASDEAEIERILFLASADRARRASSAQRQKAALLFVGGALACAAAVLLWLNVKPQAHRSNDAQASSVSVAAPRSQAPAAMPAPAPAQVEGEVDPHCSQVVPGATLCLARGTVLARRVLSGPHRELEVAKGRAVVALAPQAPGTSFSLTTTQGKVTAVGTIFSVEVTGDGGTVARVIEGKVVARTGNDDEAHPIHAGQALRLGDSQPTALSDHDRDLDLALLSVWEVNEREEQAPSASSATRAKPPVRGVEPSHPRDTLEYARSLRAAGDSRGAAEVYRKIHAEAPQSPSGRAALVSLGELLLSLGDPHGALSAFDSYLVGNGTLTQEAAFGRVRALRALNRPLDEQRAIERFLAAYPDAPQSRVLRVRLAAIKK